MSTAGIWLLRAIGAIAAGALVLVAGEAVAALRTTTWLAVPELAALELTVIASLGVAATSLAGRGRRIFALDTWRRPSGWRAHVERLALIWCASFAAVLGVRPGLSLGLGAPALWPLGLFAVATLGARTFGVESPRRVGWLLCTSYGLSATATLVVIRHVF